MRSVCFWAQEEQLMMPFQAVSREQAVFSLSHQLDASISLSCFYTQHVRRDSIRSACVL